MSDINRGTMLSNIEYLPVTFIALVSALLASFGSPVLAADMITSGQNPRNLPVVAYADRLSVQPGDTIRFMVSSHRPTYQADLLRLIHSDPNPAGPGIKQQELDAAFAGEYRGEFQALPNGSYIVVPSNPALQIDGSFTLQAWIYATTPRKGEQSIISTLSAAGDGGFSMLIDDKGALALRIGNGTVSQFTTGTAIADSWKRAERPNDTIKTAPPRSTSWYFVAVSFDATTGDVTLYQWPKKSWPLDTSVATVTAKSALRAVRRSAADLFIAAKTGGNGEPAAFFNGKIDSPRIYASALPADAIKALYEGDIPSGAAASWDFSADISSPRVSDISGNALHGRAINMPTRAVTGHNWRGDEVDFRQVPEQYAAIHFHDDDLHDAGWNVAFEYRIPKDLPSGIYAARMRSGDAVEYVPFFVRPPRGSATAPVAFLVPTFSYLAYANSFDETTPDLRGAYDHHSDGSGVAYSSRLRPILDLRPNVVTDDSWEPWQFIADTHLTDWMTTKNIPFDVITEHDLHFEGQSLLDNYKVVVTGTHPEYYSTAMLDGVEAYLQNGGRLMYMGGNGFYWVTSLDESGNAIEIRRWGGTRYWEAMPGEYHHSTTGEIGGLWRNRGRSPQQLVGVGFTAQGFDRNASYARMPGSFDPRAAFIFDGISDDEVIGDFPSLVLQHGAAGSELDRLDFALGTPTHTLLLATSMGEFTDAYQHVVEEVQTSNDGPWDALVRADMVYFEYPNGGAVWTPASIAWSGSLSYNNYENNVSRITENVLREFMTR